MRNIRSMLRLTIAAISFVALVPFVQAQTVKSAIVNLGAGTITVSGSGFLREPPPSISLGGVRLTVQTFTDTSITAALGQFTNSGTYRLTVAEDEVQRELDVTIGVVGSQGPQGMQGLPGPEGPAGAVGAPGAKGPTGLTGATGAVGPTGPAGATGATGPQGPTGPMGAAGPSGPTGPAGTDGVLGWVSNTNYAFLNSSAPAKAASLRISSSGTYLLIGKGYFTSTSAAGVGTYPHANCNLNAQGFQVDTFGVDGTPGNNLAVVGPLQVVTTLSSGDLVNIVCSSIDIAGYASGIITAVQLQ